MMVLKSSVKGAPMKSGFVVSTILLILSIASLSYGIDMCKEYLNKGEYDNAISVCTTMQEGRL